MTAAEVGSTANQYRIFAKLAVGGMAEIFLARGASVAGVARYCVLKRILRDRAHDAQLVQMFLDEARLAAQLQHPNIASVYDVGMLGESYFFTMEYVHGETVRALLARAHVAHRPIPLACALTVIAGAASGLHHAHDRRDGDGKPLGIVHRDVSPSNVMISFEGNTKLVDFGVAKADDRDVETRSGTVKGKVGYLSPEQARGVRVDRRSDLFSLGIVMWEMLTGRRLYKRNSDFETMTAVVHDEVLPPSSQRADLPRAIDDIVMKLLAKDVAQRYQTADEVVEAIENASMRAGTILSTSAVARLLRDLFGVRPEPWLTLTDAPASLITKPLPESLEPAPIDPVEAELSGVPDLSPSQVMETEELPRAQLAERARPALPGLPPPIETLAPTLVIAASPLGPFAGMRPGHPTHPAHPAHPPVVGHSTLLGTPGSGPQPILAAMQLGPQPMPSAPALATSSDMIALQGLPTVVEPPITPRRRSPAPLFVVVGLAAVAGIATVWLAMRKPAAGAHVALPAASSIDAGVERAAVVAGIDGAGIDAAVVDTAVTPDAAPDAPPAVEAPPRDASPPDAPAMRHVVAPEAPPDAPTDAPTNATGTGTDPEPHHPPQPAQPAAPQPDFEQLTNLFNNGAYEYIVAACSKARPSPDIARPCMMAACIEHKGTQAQRWLELEKPSMRSQLITYCESKGTPLR